MPLAAANKKTLSENRMSKQEEVKIEIDHKSPLSLHVQVEDLLRRMIALPEYQQGKLLPNEVSLARQLGISRSTLRQATNKLVYEGRLYRKKGVGTMVYRPVDSKAKNWLSFTQEMKSKGIKVVNYSIKLTWEEPPEEVANFFAVPEGTRLLKMERVRGNEDRPFVYFISYFSPAIGLTGEEDFSQPLYELLENKFSVIAKLSIEEITAMAATEFIAKKLGIDTAFPILKRKRYVYDPGRRPIEYNIGYYKSDSIIYTVESEREL